MTEKGKQLENIIKIETKDLDLKPKQQININEIDINDIINNNTNTEELEIITGSEKKTNIDIDTMNTDDMKKMLKELLEKNKN